MFDGTQYELLDFGAGRKLERFGPIILDRPSPAAADARPTVDALWNSAHARYELSAESSPGPQRGRWIATGGMPDRWEICHGLLRFELKLTEFGHVGLFPEQAENWDWIAGRGKAAGQPLHVLNLFAYTGASTLAAAAAGAHVTHVDAARGVVAWARRNAELSGLAAAPIRWITEDALKFCRRELRRGRRYDAVILDPPTYGHGPGGEPWKLQENLPELLYLCRDLVDARPHFILLTAHSPQYDAGRLAKCLVDAGLVQRLGNIESNDLCLTTHNGRRLHAGSFARSPF